MTAFAGSDDCRAAGRNYEKKMLPRSTQAAGVTEQGLAACISADAPQSALEYLESVGA